MNSNEPVNHLFAGHSVYTILVAIFLLCGQPVIAGFILTEDSHLEWQGSDATLTSRGAGITSITHEDADLAAVVQEVSGGIEQPLDSGMLVTYDWGSFQIEWIIEAGVVTGNITLTNTSEIPIADFSIQLLKWVLPDPDADLDGFTEYIWDNLDKVAYHSWHSGEMRVTVGLPSVDPPLKLSSTLSPDSETTEWAIHLTGGVSRMDDGGITYPILGTARVEPGGSLNCQILLKESQVGVPENVATAIFRSQFYKETFHEINWPDRRPIGMLFMTEKHSETNPKGLFWDEDLDITDANAVLESALSYAENSVEALLQLNAQGAIAWDIEGTDLPIFYVGDPRMLPILNPAMDLVADAFFKVFTDAGLEVGVTLRPTQVYFNEGNNQWNHGTGSHGPTRNPLEDNFDDVWPDDLPWWRFYPIVERMDRKIQYAKDRWGCRLFYIDTNGIFRETGTPGGFPFILLDASIIRELMNRHPDILIIPELEKTNNSSGTHLAYWGTCAPYGELDLGDKGTPDWIRESYPNAFSVVNVSDGDIEANRDALVEAVRSGDIIFCRGWFKDARNSIVREIYDEASNP